MPIAPKKRRPFKTGAFLDEIAIRRIYAGLTAIVESHISSQCSMAIAKRA